MITFLVKLIFLVVCILHNQYSIQAAIFSCNPFASCGCSRYDVDINSRIIGGEVALNHSWGWAVSLRVVNELHFCGGTILSPEYILTAAHCVDDPEIMDYDLRAAVGTDTLSDGIGQRLPVSEIFLHPRWTPRTNENDIAILKLKTPIEFSDVDIARICFPFINGLIATEFPVAKSSLVAIGWGYTTADGLASEFLRQVTVEAIENNETKCNNSINNITLQFCAAVNGGGKDTCEGDSGGPLMYFSEQYGQWIIAGITSYGRGCGLSIHAGVYTRVSVYIDWIQSITGIDGIVIAGESINTTFESTTLPIEKSGANTGIISNIFLSRTFLLLIVLNFKN